MFGCWRAAIAAPQGLFVGVAGEDGRREVRLGWFAPDDWASVQLRSWEISTGGGLAAVAAGDFLYREDFTHAPLVKGNPQLFDSGDWLTCTDLYADGFWDDKRSVRIYKTIEEGVVQIGTTDFSGCLVSSPIDLSGEQGELALVVCARKAANDSPERKLAVHFIDSATWFTNRTETPVLASGFSELVFPLAAAQLAAPFRIALSGNPNGDRRAFVDTIALVRGYAEPTPVTNVLEEARDLGTARYAGLGDWPDGSVRHFSLRGVAAPGFAGEWSEPIAVDPATADEWRPNWLPLSRRVAEISLDPESLPVAGGKVSIAGLPFMAAVDGKVARELSLKDAAMNSSVGFYCYTNVFGRSWVALVPGAPANSADFRMSEMRLCVAAEGAPLRQLSVQVECAQMSARNKREKVLQLQCRSRRAGETFGEWQTLAEYRSRFTSSDSEPDLASARQTLQAIRRLNLPAGSEAEVRVYCVKPNDSGPEPPLAWRNLRVTAEGGCGFSVSVR